MLKFLFDDENGDNCLMTIDLIKKFNEEINDFILYHILYKITTDKNEIDEENLIGFVKAICDIFKRIENKIEKTNSSTKQGDLDEFSDMIYINFFKLILVIENEHQIDVFDLIFYEFWKVFFKIKNACQSKRDKEEKFKQLEVLENFKIECRETLSKLFCRYFNDILDEDNQIKTFNKFIDNFIPKILNSLNVPSNNFIETIFNFQKHFTVEIKYIYDLYFVDFHLTKDKLLFQKVYKELNLVSICKQNNSNENSILRNIIESKHFHTILIMMRLLIYDEFILGMFLRKFLSFLKLYFEEIYINCLKEEKKISKRNLDFFIELRNVEEGIIEKIKSFTNNIIEINKIEKEFKNSINQILNSRKEKEIFFSESFDLILRFKQFDLMETAITYFNSGGIPDIGVFEDDYIKKMIERAIDEVFDKLTETETVNKITNSNKESFTYTFKLQTAISNIKILRKSFINLVGVPAHCYHKVLAIQPVLKDTEMLKLFEDAKNSPNSNFPKNSKLIFQQGFIEFTFSYSPGVLYKSNLLEFLILKKIYERSEWNLKELNEFFEMDIETCLFILENLVDNKLVEKEVPVYTDNKNYASIIYKRICKKIPMQLFETKINLILDLNEDFQKFKNFKLKSIKENETNFSHYKTYDVKHFNNILDCYIIKILKKSPNKHFSYNDMFTLLISLTNLKNYISQFEVDINRILQRLNHLAEKSFIKKLNEKIFCYV